MVEKKATPPSSQTPQGAPAGGEQAGQQVRLRFDEREMQTTYANAFRTNSTGDEVILDMGMNFIVPGPGQEPQPEIAFKVSNRVVMNYYTAKRLAIMLSQLVRRHEEQFGTLELDVNKRRIDNK